MPLEEAEKVVASLGEIHFVASPARKRDYIFSSAKVTTVTKKLFLAWDNAHWALGCHVVPPVSAATRDATTDSEQSEQELASASAATRDLKKDAQDRASKHIKEQQEIVAKGCAEAGR